MGLRLQRQTPLRKLVGPIPVSIWLAIICLVSTGAAETAVYLKDAAKDSVQKSGAVSAKPRSSLLSQWTEPAPRAHAIPSGQAASRAAHDVKTAGFNDGPLGLFGQSNNRLNAAVQAPAPAQLPPGYGSHPNQTVPSAGGLLGLGGGLAGSLPSPYSSKSPAPPGFGGAGFGGAVSNPYGSPYAANQGYNPSYIPQAGHGQPPAGYAVPQPGYGGYQPATAPQSGSPYPFETLGSENATDLPAPSAAPMDAGVVPNTNPTYGDLSDETGSGYSPGNSWGGNGGYNSHGYQSFDDDCGYQPQPQIPTFEPYAETPYPTGPVTIPQLGCRSLCGCDPTASNYWWRADVLFGWLNGFDTPRLLTRSPEGTDFDDIVDPASPFTKTVIGGNSFGDDVRIGGRIGAGVWFDSCRKWGAQIDGFALGNDSEDFFANSRGGNGTILSRPFYNEDPLVDANDGQVISMLGVAEGSFTTNTTGRLISVGPSLRFNICCCGPPPLVAVPCCDPCDPCCDPCAAGDYSSAALANAGGCSGGSCGVFGRNTSSRVDLVAGYRYLQLREGYFAREVLSPLSGGFTTGTDVTLVDDVDTQNDFHALELGAIWQVQRDKLLFDFGWTAAFGEVTRRTTATGSTTYRVPELLDETFVGGFSVRPEQVGSFEDSRFTVVPQARIGVGYCLYDNIRLHLDYSFLYFDNVFRPGSVLTNSFDGSTLGAEPGPGVVGSAVGASDDESVIFHALSLGISCNY